MRGVTRVLRPVFDWAYRRPNLFPLLVDLEIWVLGLLIGATLKLVFSVDTVGWELFVLAIAAMAIQGGLGWITGVYRHRWRVSSFDEVSALGPIWAITPAY